MIDYTRESWLEQMREVLDLTSRALTAAEHNEAIVETRPKSAEVIDALWAEVPSHEFRILRDVVIELSWAMLRRKPSDPADLRRWSQARALVRAVRHEGYRKRAETR